MPEDGGTGGGGAFFVVPFSFVLGRGGRGTVGVRWLYQGLRGGDGAVTRATWLYTCFLLVSFYYSGYLDGFITEVLLVPGVLGCVDLGVMMLTGRIPSAHGIKGSTVGTSNAVGHTTLPTVFGPRSLGTLRRTLELGSARPNSAMAVLAVNPKHTTRVVHRNLCEKTSGKCLLASHTFTNTSALTASCTVTATVHGVNRYSLVVNNHRTVSNSATRMNPRMTRGLKLDRVACARRVLGISRATHHVAMGHRVSKKMRAIRNPLPVMLAIGKDTTPYHPHGTGLLRGCGHTLNTRRGTTVAGSNSRLPCTRLCRGFPCLGVAR